MDHRRRELLDHACEALFSTELDGTILDANESAGTALGIDIAAKRPEALLLCVGQADAESVRRVLETIARTSSAELELHLRSPGGRELWAVRAKLGREAHSVLWSAATIGDRKSAGLRRLVLDKTDLLTRERDRAEQERAANVAKDRLLAIVGEDSSATLNSVLGWTRMLRRELLDTAARDMALAVIEGNVERHLRLLSELLELARIVEGQAQIDLRRIALAPFVEKSLGALRTAANETGVAITFTSPDGGDANAAEILGDAAKLDRLVRAAVEAFLGGSALNGRVVVEVLHDDGSCVLRVTGSTGSAKVISRSTAVRLPAVSSDAFHGTADLAFLLVDRIARVHGALATEFTSAEGKRIVEVRFPSVVGAVLDPPAGPRVEAPLHGVRVLVFEPDPEMRDLTGMHLRDNGAIVLGARDASTAATAVTAFRPDVVFVGLVDGNDEALLSAIRAAAKGRRLGLVSSSSLGDEGYFGPARRVLVEVPYDAEKLVSAVRRSFTADT